MKTDAMPIIHLSKNKGNVRSFYLFPSYPDKIFLNHHKIKNKRKREKYSSSSRFLFRHLSNPCQTNIFCSIQFLIVRFLSKRLFFFHQKSSNLTAALNSDSTLFTRDTNDKKNNNNKKEFHNVMFKAQMAKQNGDCFPFRRENCKLQRSIFFYILFFSTLYINTHTLFFSSFSLYCSCAQCF